MNQYELAKRSGVSQGHISAILNGKKPNPGVETIRRISFALGVRLSDIIDDDPALLEFCQSYDITFEEYVQLSDVLSGGARPVTASGWREIYERMRADRYPGLAGFLHKSNLGWEHVRKLIESMAGKGLPQTVEGWEDLYTWYKTLG